MQPLINRLRSLLDRVLQCALPDDRHAPAERMEHPRMAPVTIDIFLELLLPEHLVGPGSGGIATALVSMPEAAVDENHGPVLRKHKVWGAGQSPHMKSISKPLGEKKGAKYPFRPGVLSANARHHAAALRRGRNAHDLEYLPPVMSAEMAVPRALAMRTGEGDAGSGNPELTMRLSHTKMQGGTYGS